MDNSDLKNTFKKAIELGKNRNYEESSRLLLEIIKTGNELPEAYLFLGRCYHSLNRMEEAVQVLKHYLTITPDSPSGNFFLGRSLLSMEIPGKAVYYLRKAVEAHPKSAYANGFLGIAYLKSGRSDLALNFLTIAVESTKSDSGIYKIYLGTLFVRGINSFKTGDYSYASQVFTFLISAGFNSILPYIYMGMIERNFKNYKKALEYYEKAIEIAPDDELLLYRRAVLLHKIGDSEQAVIELKKLNIEPDVDENIFLAYKYFENKNFNKAVYYGNLSLHRDNSNTDIHLLLAEAYRELNKPEIARNHYNRTLKLDRSRIEARYGLALLLWIEEDYEKMLSELNKIDINDPYNGIGSYYKALCKCNLNYDTEETIPLIQEEIRNNDPDGFLFNALGEEYIKGDYEELAEKWFIKALKVNKNYKSPFLNLINIYTKNGEETKLLEILKSYLMEFDDLKNHRKYIHLLYKLKDYTGTIEEILKLSPYLSKNPTYLRILANSYRLTRKWNEGIMTYKQLLQKDPENETFLRALIYCLDHSGKRITAIELLDNALGYLKKPTIDLILIKGVLCFKEEQYNEALSCFRQTLDSNPGDWRIYNNIAMIYRKKGMADYAEQFLSRAEKYKNK